MKIKMLQDMKGSENGVTVKQFNQGQIYMMSDDLAGVFVLEKWAVEMDTPEALEKERRAGIGRLGNELSKITASCFEPGIDSVQLMDRIENLKAYSVTEDAFQERFKEAQKIKATGIRDAEKSLKALNRSNAKGKK